MNNFDKRNRLGDEPFNFRVSKDKTVFLDYNGRQVKVIKGTEAEKFLKRINAAENTAEEQLVMAKITGNFKRGNE
ncbi:hypothetical protein [Neobacillus sp. YIM B06451]|uniref:hypothetical protein n=1 Tax=Neobacillus sp. YIM B06451 TaxID=3070994 RepID=UPI002931260C|nr:hypothetical protein [Neobacillus sp. YIM B06451]